jgi:GNAT superfamily N-acetyltransferase
MSSTLLAALRIDRNVRVRAAQRSLPVPGGTAIFHDELHVIHYLNTVLLAAPLDPDLGAADLLALVERCHGHLHDRYLVLEDAPAAERLAPDLLRAGWERRRTLFMDWRGGAPSRDPRAREISDAELRELQRQIYSEERFPIAAPPALRAALVEAQSALRAGTRSRRFGAGVDGGLQSMSTLFLDEDDEGPIAMVEEVATLSAFRRRGLAGAVVRAAVDAALHSGATRIVIPTDAEDWPQVLYAGLGFEPLGSSVSFTLHGGSR